MDIFSQIEHELAQLGYAGDLLRKDYVFDDAQSATSLERRIPFAAFAQSPPSYRNACIGVVKANGIRGPGHVAAYSALGAPLFFEVYLDNLRTYMVRSPGKIDYCETIKIGEIANAFAQNRNSWQPDSIFRAKTLGLLPGQIQLDFVDAGLLPALKGMIHKKLDRILREIIFNGANKYKENRNGVEPDPAELFRLVFRLLAAKVFRDRGQPGKWAQSSSDLVIDAVQKFYGLTPTTGQQVLSEPSTQQLVWDQFIETFNFQNLSVEDLAYIYENTLIQPETRKKFGIHSTPPVIADLIVDRLPFESIQQEDRYVFEPCSGHGAFLIAALRRLKELLPKDWSAGQKHRYLRDRLSGIEIDFFAAEVCLLALTLADYPNPDGWNIVNDDIFIGITLEDELKKSNIVLCNPPFEDFSDEERKRYQQNIQSTHKPYEILNRVISGVPDMLGFILPKSALSGHRYKAIQDTVARKYRKVEVILLPDRIFTHSDAETALLIAFERDDTPKLNSLSNTIRVKEKHRKNLLGDTKLPAGSTKLLKRDEPVDSIRLLSNEFTRIWEYLVDNQTLSDIAQIKRGIEWNISLKKNKGILKSEKEKDGFKIGLDIVHDKISSYITKGHIFLNMDASYQRGNSHNLNWSQPKVIANHLSISRNPWRIVGAPDITGLVCYHNYFGIWPKTPFRINTVSALINSPLINAFLFDHDMQKHNKKITLANAPIPSDLILVQDEIIIRVNKFIDLIGKHKTAISDDYAHKLLLEIDSLILKAYDLPPKLERQLLDFFSGHQRPVPFKFTEYYPSDFTAWIPLHEYLETDWGKSAAGSLLERLDPLDSPEFHNAMQAIEECDS